MIIKSILIICSLFLCLSAQAKCWSAGERAPRFCATLEIVNFAASDPKKYYSSDCVISTKVQKSIPVYTAYPLHSRLTQGEIIEVTTPPSNCETYKNQIGKTVTVELESICRDKMMGEKFAGPAYDILKDPFDCNSVEASDGEIIPKKWQKCKLDSDCEIYGPTCGGVPYNKVFSKQVKEKLAVGFLCKQLLPEFYFMASCFKGQCANFIAQKSKASGK